MLDHCRAVEQIVLRGRDGETYNVGSGREATIDEIADLVLDTLGKPDSLKTIVPDRPGHDRRYLLDCHEAAARARAGQPQVEFEPGLRATVEWYAANRAWWEPLLDRAPVVETAWSAGPASGAVARARPRHGRGGPGRRPRGRSASAHHEVLAAVTTIARPRRPRPGRAGGRRRSARTRW